MKKIVLAVAFLASLGYGYYFFNIENTKTIEAAPTVSARMLIAPTNSLEDVIVQGRTVEGVHIFIDNPQCYDSIQIAKESETLIKESNLEIKVINVQDISNALYVNNNACVVSLNQLYDGDTGTYTIPSIVTIANGQLVESVTLSNVEEVNAWKNNNFALTTAFDASSEEAE